MQKLIIILVTLVTEALCSQMNYEKDKQKDFELFANFKPETTVHSKWGNDSAEHLLTTCKK